MEKLYTFWYSSDYRSGAKINYENVKEDWYEIMEEVGMIEDLRFEAKVKHPESGYKVLLGCEFDKYEIIKEWSFESKNDSINHINKAFSQINDCLPFKITGHNIAYKEEGYYPEVSQDIKNMKDINLDIPLYTDNIYFLVLLDKDKILYTLSLTRL